MKNRRSPLTVFVLLLIVTVSCAEISKEVMNWLKNPASEKIATKSHYLEDDDIKITLPVTFERYEIADYKKLLDSVVSKEQYKAEVDRLNNLKDIEGNLYLFIDRDYAVSYTINTMEYTPFTKQDAQYLLNVVGDELRATAKKQKLEVEKITAKYSGAVSQQIFKTVYKVSDPKKKETWYTSTYFVSANDKTVVVQVITPFEIDFNPFIEQMIL